MPLILFFLLFSLLEGREREFYPLVFHNAFMGNLIALFLFLADPGVHGTRGTALFSAFTYAAENHCRVLDESEPDNWQYVVDCSSALQ